MSLPHRVAGNLALDLANTISWRGTDREIDHLVTPADILAWSRAAGLTDGHFAVRPADHKALMKGILDLRLAIGEVGSAIAAGKPSPRAALDIIRDYAAKALRTASLAGRPVSLRFQGIDSIAGAVSWSALDLLRSDELSRLKQCPSDDCRWLFIDRTKNGSRRWCEMSTCGNRAKKQAFRRGPS